MQEPERYEYTRPILWKVTMSTGKGIQVGEHQRLAKRQEANILLEEGKQSSLDT